MYLIIIKYILNKFLKKLRSWGSSVGRALVLWAKGRRFESFLQHFLLFFKAEEKDDRKGIKLIKDYIQMLYTKMNIDIKQEKKNKKIK